MKAGILKRRWTDGLLFRFSLLFATFTIVTLLFSGIATYVTQTKAYKAQCVENIRNVGEYLEALIQDSKEEFISYQNYYMEHFAEADIPYDFTEFITAQREYETILATSNSQEESKPHLDFEDFTDDVKKAYFKYIHEYWLLTFEHAREAFSLPYTYYLVPKDDIYHMVYMIDGERTHKGPNGEKADEGELLYLGDEYYNNPEEYRVEWKTWFTGEPQDEFEVWDNAWGYTYAYYIPLIINGQKLGLIGTEIEVEKVNKDILLLSCKISILTSLGLITCIILVLFIINHCYIKKISLLEAQMLEYAEEKDPEIAIKIAGSITGRNEISSLTHQFAYMIFELEEHMKSLVSTKKELNDTKQIADEMNVLANKDALTGVRNKTAYNNETRRLEWHIDDGNKNFGLAMIDLNFLKRINDTYGHERGDIAIKKLCKIICHVFKNSHVFRIGGDEFIVILEKEEFFNAENLVKEFKSQINLISKDVSIDPWERVSAAIGYAAYDENLDSSVTSLFRRADKAMYAYKKEMKGEHER